MKTLDLFSAAAGGWSLGMHRAGFQTIAACEVVDWRRALYSVNNPGVPVYEDVTTLTAERLIRDGVGLPDIVVGSPPCQDISPANTRGKGVDGERSGLYFEAIRLIDECRPRWYALENSANLRTRGADRVIDALAEIGYTCWPFVVSAGNIGANHERKRSWLIGIDVDSSGIGYESWRSRRRWSEGYGTPSTSARNDGDSDSQPRPSWVDTPTLKGENEHSTRRLRPLSEPRRNGSGAVLDESKVGTSSTTSFDVAGPWSDWNGSIAGHLQLDDGLSAWLADTRVAVGGPRGTSAGSLIVEAFGDAVVPQIPESIGRAILAVEKSLSQPANDNTNQDTANAA